VLALISLFKEETSGNVLLQVPQVYTITYGFVDTSGSGFEKSNVMLRNVADNTKILCTFYCREKNRFNWIRYVSFHKECHNDLEGTGTVMPEDDKVHHLLMVIQHPAYRLQSCLRAPCRHFAVTLMLPWNPLQR
jgi:hypothetical protein